MPLPAPTNPAARSVDVRRRRIRIAVVTLLLSAFAGLLFTLSNLRSTGPSVQLAFSLAPGQFVEHDITIVEDASLSPVATLAPTTARTDLSVRLRLEGISGDTPAGTSLVAASFVSIERASTTINGANTLGPAAALVGPVATVTLGHDGLVDALSALPSDSPDFARVLQLVLRESALPLGSGMSWSAIEALPRGTFLSTVRTRAADSASDSASDSEGIALSRSRVMTGSSAPRADLTHTPNVQGATTARVRADGTLLELLVTESVTAFDDQDAPVESRHTKVTSRLVHQGAATPAL